MVLQFYLIHRGKQSDNKGDFLIPDQLPGGFKGKGRLACQANVFPTALPTIEKKGSLTVDKVRSVAV